MTNTVVSLSEDQEQALEAVFNWFKNEPHKQEFFLAGYAGTGKSTLVPHIAHLLGLSINYEIAFCTFTGKASLVLTQKSMGKYIASTIHKLIYRFDSLNKKGEPQFELKDKTALSHLKLIIVDEASMVNDMLAEHLRSFDIRILYIGDHGQLPPVGKGNTVAKRILTCPDTKLEVIHRQARGNPIIQLSMMAREGRVIQPGIYGDSVCVIPRDSNLINDFCLKVDQIIVGTNRNRQDINNKMRSILGFRNTFPEKGDKLICLKNNWERYIETSNYGLPLVNGMIGYATAVEEYGQTFNLNFKPEDSDGPQFKHLIVLKPQFLGENVRLSKREYRLYDQFDYAYAVTCHKAQGSQWNNVLVFNDAFIFRDDYERWLYTAITRASKKLILVT